jgi:polyhydroxybutyrate depolymerase
MLRLGAPARWLARLTFRSGRAALGLAVAVLGCEDAVRDESFVEPVSGRAYRVVTRTDHDPAHPAAVLFALHAYATAPEVLVDGYSLVRRAVKMRGFVLVVPEGRRDLLGNYSWNASKACCGRGERPDDVGYLRGVLADLRTRYAVDPARAYAIGVSNGGFMAHRWACEPGGDVAGIVSIAGAAQGPDDPPCAPSRKVSVLQIHGTRDLTIRYAGSPTGWRRYPSARDSALFWATHDETRAEPVVGHHRSVLLESVRTETWQAESARVALWSIDGGDHLLRSMRFEVMAMLDFLEGA